MKNFYDFNIALFVVLLALDTQNDIFPAGGRADDALSLWAIFTVLIAVAHVFTVVTDCLGVLWQRLWK